MPRIHGKPADTFWISPAVPAAQVTISAITWIGVEFAPQVNGRIFGGSVYQLAGGWPPQSLLLFDKGGSTPLLQKVPVQLSVTANTWNNCWFGKSYRVVPGRLLRICMLMVSQYSRTTNGLSSFVTHNNIEFFNSFQTTSNNPPNAAITLNTNLNGIDVLFQPD